MKTKAEFLSHFQRKPEAVRIGDREMFLMPLSMVDVADIRATSEPEKQAGLSAVRSICDRDGARLFQDSEVDEYRGSVSLVDQDAIYLEIARLNRLGGEKGKNPSPASQSLSSSSGSPATSE